MREHYAARLGEIRRLDSRINQHPNHIGGIAPATLVSRERMDVGNLLFRGVSPEAAQIVELKVTLPPLLRS